MTVTIWIDGWQMECCGEGFGPGGGCRVATGGDRG
ncbi:DUF6578 domain-containing protein [Streptomyces sp. CS227]